MIRLPAFALHVPVLAAAAASGRLPAAAASGRRARTMCSAQPSPPPMRVLITGSTAGLGLALAEGFVRRGAHVVVNSRREAAVEAAVEHLRGLALSSGEELLVAGSAGNIGVPGDVERLFEVAFEQLSGLDAVICNAGASTLRAPLSETAPHDIVDCVNATFTGALLTTQAAMARGVGHLFLMEGAGSDGLPTPRMATYGACKRGLGHLAASLRREKGATKVHLLSPGMMPTRLLLKTPSTQASRFVFNALCEEPTTVADWMVPQVEAVVREDRRPSAMRFLTIAGGVRRLAGRAILGWRKDRLFIESSGERVGGGDYDEMGVLKTSVDAAVRE